MNQQFHLLTYYASSHAQAVILSRDITLGFSLCCISLSPELVMNTKAITNSRFSFNVVSREYWLSFFPYHFSACNQGLYKAGLGNTQCQSCPANSTVVGAVTCNCTHGHYRMNGEGIADPCTSKLLGVLICFSFIENFAARCSFMPNVPRILSV